MGGVTLREMINKLKGLFFRANIVFHRNIPRPSTIFTKEFFENKKIDVIEVGTEFGINAKSILKELNINKIFLIDPYEVYKEQKIKDNLVNSEKKAKKRLKEYKDKIIWIKEYSDKAIHKVPKVDFIYLDGNHGYNFVKEDIKNYYEKLNFR